MPLPEDPRAWFELQTQTLRRVHVSWLPDFPPELITRARNLSLGRRWLAIRLLAVSPVLFDLPQDLGSDAVAGLRAAEWLAPVVREPVECALDLGSLAMGAQVRNLVNRLDVMKLRAALGSERYARVLAAPGLPSQVPVPAAPAAGAAGPGDDKRDVVERLIRCGAAELAAYADSLHAAWGESVRLTFERGWWLDAPLPSLPAEAAEACLRLREHSTGESH